MAGSLYSQEPSMHCHSAEKKEDLSVALHRASRRLHILENKKRGQLQYIHLKHCSV